LTAVTEAVALVQVSAPLALEGASMSDDDLEVPCYHVLHRQAQ
jgi:hypothetical protein